MIALDASGYRRQRWKNGGGVSEEIAALRKGSDDGWQDLVWSFSRTGFAGTSGFSDLSGIARVLVLAKGQAFSLRALDSGADIAVASAEPVAFDGGRMLEAVTEGPVEVVNLMGRTNEVSIAMTVATKAENARTIRADIVLLHAAFGPVQLKHATLAAGGTLLFDEGEAEIAVQDGSVLVATIRYP